MDGRRFEQWAKQVAIGPVGRRALLGRALGALWAAPLTRFEAGEATAGECRPVGAECRRHGQCCSNSRCRNGRCRCRAGYKRCGSGCCQACPADASFGGHCGSGSVGTCACMPSTDGRLFCGDNSRSCVFYEECDPAGNCPEGSFCAPSNCGKLLCQPSCLTP